MSDPVRPHRWQPTRLSHPWDSPGKNTGVGCHLLLQCMKVKSEREVAQSCPTQRPHGLQPTRLLRPWDFPGKSTGVGCHCLLQVVWILCNNKTILSPSSHPLYDGLTGGVRLYFTYTWACIIKYIVVVLCILNKLLPIRSIKNKAHISDIYYFPFL